MKSRIKQFFFDLLEAFGWATIILMYGLALALLLAGCASEERPPAIPELWMARPQLKTREVLVAQDPPGVSATWSNGILFVWLTDPNTNRWVIEYSWPTNDGADPSQWYWSYGPGCVTTGQVPVGFFTRQEDCPVAQPFQLYRARLLQ